MTLDSHDRGIVDTHVGSSPRSLPRKAQGIEDFSQPRRLEGLRHYVASSAS